MFTTSQGANKNYLCKVVKIDNIRNHNNADKLEIITIDDCNIIVAKESVNIGDIMVFCPTECCLNKNFLRNYNLFDDKSLNADPEQKGYFNKHGRVRAINLRGENSRGFLFPITWLECLGKSPETNNANIEFDTFNGTLFCKKYVPARINSQPNYNKSNKRNKHLKQFDKLIENQFNFHYDTEMLAKHLDKFDSDDIISITSKFHGTSLIVSKCLVKRDLKWYEKILQKLKIKIQDKEYDTLISSRSVIKNRYIDKGGKSYYDVDIWTEAGTELSKKMRHGETFYAEIVGYLSNTSCYVQKGFDYGCNEGEYKIYVYRITSTNDDGDIFELSAKQIQQVCHERNLNAVKELYYGNIFNINYNKEVEENWQQEFLSYLKEEKKFAMEQDSPDCNNKVPHEGIVIRNESKPYLHAYKLKCEKFYQWESKQLDTEEENIEDNN